MIFINRRLLLGIIVGVVAVVALVLILTGTGQLLRTQVTQREERVFVVGGQLAAGLPVGGHTLEFRSRTSSGVPVRSQTRFTIAARPSGDGDGGSETGGGGEEPPPTRGRELIPQIGVSVERIGNRIALPAEEGKGSTVALVGDTQFSSTKQTLGNIVGTLLAHDRVRADYRVSVPRGRYLLELRAQNDRPAPVRIAVSVNGKTWKVVEFTKGNGKLDTLPVGILRDFAGGRITFRLLNDFFDRQRFLSTFDERFDRNAFIDTLLLTPVR